jgi:hypothetical protein
LRWPPRPQRRRDTDAEAAADRTLINPPRRHCVTSGSRQIRMAGGEVRRDDAAVIATSRVARQTSRWARFAVVTVEVTAAVTDTVAVAHGVRGNEATRQEAVYGAREALRHVPPGRGSHQVSVTEIVTTEVDTGVGDVYETTARAVHQALSLNSPPVVGLSEPKMASAGTALSGIMWLQQLHDHPWVVPASHRPQSLPNAQVNHPSTVSASSRSASSADSCPAISHPTAYRL